MVSGWAWPSNIKCPGSSNTWNQIDEDIADVGDLSIQDRIPVEFWQKQQEFDVIMVVKKEFRDYKYYK